MSEENKYNLKEAHTTFAKQTNGLVWELLGKDNRTQEENEEMLYAAFTSIYHWLQVGTGLHHQRGEWMISHVYAVLGDGENALRHAKRCQELTETHKDLMSDFDIGYARESMARAYAALGDREATRKYFKLAEEIGEQITNEEDRGWFIRDLKGGNWHGMI